MTKRKTKPRKRVEADVRRGWGVTEYGRIMPHVFFKRRPVPIAPERVVRLVIVRESHWRRILKQLKRGPQ